jgi:hypothetical protein
MQYRFILEPYKGIKTRFICPDCKDGSKTFSRYLDTETNKHISPLVGKCNRTIKCGYHYQPKAYFQDNKIVESIHIRKHIIEQPKQKITSFINAEIFKKSLKQYEENNFIQFLIGMFGIDITNKLIATYYIGTSKHWKGANVFWQVDIKGKIRTGKIILYNPETGKRVKQPYNHISWVQSALKMPNFNLKQCFFGEHLLVDKSKNVMVVEAEKTAIISSVYMPDYIWLACGGINNINKERCEVLKGRNVIFHPDIGAYEKWNSKVKEFSLSENFKVSKLLEINADIYNLGNGSDIADYFVQNRDKNFGWAINSYGYPLFWD